MPKLTSAVDPQSQKYKSLHAHNSAMVAQLGDQGAVVRVQGLELRALRIDR